MFLYIKNLHYLFISCNEIHLKHLNVNSNLPSSSTFLLYLPEFYLLFKVDMIGFQNLFCFSKVKGIFHFFPLGICLCCLITLQCIQFSLSPFVSLHFLLFVSSKLLLSVKIMPQYSLNSLFKLLNIDVRLIKNFAFQTY